jgi:hypothetical protein
VTLLHSIPSVLTISGVRRGLQRLNAALYLVSCMAAILLCAGSNRVERAGKQTPEQTPPAQVPGVVTAVEIDSDHVTLAPGDSRQFAATVKGTGAFSSALKWSVNDVVGGTAALGTISKTGLYLTPYPTPAAVTIKATSTADPTKSASATITFAAPPLAAGPALVVDAAAATHPISPLIYGMNSWRLPGQRATGREGGSRGAATA